MNDERDPELEVLFAGAATDAPNGAFADKVMVGVESRRRNLMYGRIAIVALIVLLEVLLSAPVQNTVGAIVDVLSTPLIEFRHPIAEMILTPVNSIAGIAGGLLLLVHFLYRRVLR